MEIQSFIQHFAAQFEETDTSNFTKDTVFKNIEEWSSLIALSVIAMVDEEYQILLKGEDIKKATTIEELYTIILSKI